MSGGLTTDGLMALARGAGCGCKLDPRLLADALSLLPVGPPDPRVVVDHRGLDDAAVYRLDEETALVASVDFFTPIVDDPATFGAIAATNALSDLHAMGARPTMALAVAAFPADGDARWLSSIFAGGAEAALAEGCPVLGGHTIDDPEPKYGLCAVGTAHPDRLLRNDAGRPGDHLLLTKPLGVGIVVAAQRAGADAPVAAAVDAMLRSNAAASRAALAAGARCATDVTGFGLLGHLRELAAASGVAARVHAHRVPVLPGALDLARDGHVTGGGRRNRAFLAEHLDVEADVGTAERALLTDPQTSGGLLVAAPESAARAIVADPGAGAVEIGELAPGPAGRVEVLP